MKSIALIIHALSAIAEAVGEFFRRRDNRKRQEEAREILDNPDPELERRGWLRDDSADDLSNSGQDRDQ